MPSSQNIIVFTDLDGCLLNKTDYSWADAAPALASLRRLEIPVVLCSSKTSKEMSQLQAELRLAEFPFIAENGGAISWPEDMSPDGEATTGNGQSREFITSVLAPLRSEYKFRTFRDMGVTGIIEATDLSADRAAAANSRLSTEPLQWNDTEDRLNHFRRDLESSELTLTRGGRFWHVAGRVTKGDGMQVVLHRYHKRRQAPLWKTIAVGDSPIDQSMLDLADYPIGIPHPDGSIHVTINAGQGRIATQPGAAGWAESINAVLKELRLEL